MKWLRKLICSVIGHNFQHIMEHSWIMSGAGFSWGCRHCSRCGLDEEFRRRMPDERV